MKTDILVAGAGASGLMAAICAARAGVRVAVVEKKKEPGKKILATGNGKCNYTNQVQNPSCYRSSSKEELVTKIREQFTYEDTVQFFQELGIVPYEKNGYVYPYSGQASSVLQVLLLELKKRNVPIYTEEPVKEIRSGKNGGWEVVCASQRWNAKKIILACGGMASPNLGSDGSGYELCRQMGHQIVPVAPALTGLQAQGMDFKLTAGVRTPAKVDLYIDDKLVCSDRGELQLTAYGISGIPVFQISRYATLALKKQQSVTAVIQYVPDLYETMEQLMEVVWNRRKPEKTCGAFLTGFLNQKLALALLSCAGIKEKQPSMELSQKQLKQLVKVIWKQRLTITGDTGMEHAQVCAGGVSLEEIKPDTMESKKMPGIYLAGEVLDVDGICGGYNLQWAWTTGFVAGNGTAQTLMSFDSQKPM